MKKNKFLESGRRKAEERNQKVEVSRQYLVIAISVQLHEILIHHSEIPTSNF